MQPSSNLLAHTLMFSAEFSRARAFVALASRRRFSRRSRSGNAAGETPAPRCYAHAVCVAGLPKSLSLTLHASAISRYDRCLAR